MNTKLAVLVVAGGSFLGGVVADLLFRGRDSLAAHGPPLPPVPAAIAADGEKPAAPGLAERFQAVIKQVGPCVVAVDAVKPRTDATPKGKPYEEEKVRMRAHSSRPFALVREVYRNQRDAWNTVIPESD